MRNARYEKVRFSRAEVLALLDRQIQTMRARWKFDPDNGTAQLRRWNRDEYQDACVAYGRLEELKWLREELSK